MTYSCADFVSDLAVEARDLGLIDDELLDGPDDSFPDGQQLAAIADAIIRAVRALHRAAAELADRCDGTAGVRADGSNIDTLRLRVALAPRDFLADAERTIPVTPDLFDEARP